MNKKEHWIATLIIQMEANSLAYFVKFIFFLLIVIIAYGTTDGYSNKIIFILTYTPGICIDSYFLQKQVDKENLVLKAGLIVNMVVLWALTLSLIVLLIFTYTIPNFTQSIAACYCNIGMNLFVIFATMQPLFEAVVNCIGQQSQENEVNEQ